MKSFGLDEIRAAKDGREHSPGRTDASHGLTSLRPTEILERCRIMHAINPGQSQRSQSINQSIATRE